MSEIMKVRQLENKNQFILQNDNQMIFQSYNSIVAVLDKETGELVLGRHWDYSKTTTKHLYIFIDDNAWYYLTNEERELLYETKRSSNRKKAIQKLINEEKIKYDESLV